MVAGVGWRKFASDLAQGIKRDRVSSGAAALAYYFMLSIFPAAIALIAVIAFLPIPHLEEQVMGLLLKALPEESGRLFHGVVKSVTSNRQGGLLSLSLFFSFWSASSGIFAVMDLLNLTYEVEETRPIWKTRGTALGLAVGYVMLIPSAFLILVFGGVVRNWLSSHFGFGALFNLGFEFFRWVLVGAMIPLSFGLIYSFGPNVPRARRQKRFRWLSAGTLVGSFLLVAASLVFKLYVSDFGKYGATYGSLGAAIVLMLWLYIAGFVILLGSQIDVLFDRYRSQERLLERERDLRREKSARLVGARRGRAG